MQAYAAGSQPPMLRGVSPSSAGLRQSCACGAAGVAAKPLYHPCLITSKRVAAGCIAVTRLVLCLLWPRSTASHLTSSTYMSSRMILSKTLLPPPRKKRIMKDKKLEKLVTGFLARKHADLE